MDSNLEIKNNSLEFILIHKNCQLSKGIYSLDILVAEGTIRAPILRMNGIFNFQILHEKEIWPSFLLASNFINKY